MSGGTAIVTNNGVYVATLAATRQVACLVAVLILKMPAINMLSVEVVNHNLVVVIRSSKHVAGLIQYDRFLVFNHDLMDKGAGRSRLGTERKAGIGREVGAILNVENVIVGNEGGLAVREWTVRLVHVEENYFLAAGRKNPEQVAYLF